MKLLHKSVSRPTLEGAGVKLKRAFGFQETSLTDPFLLLDDFRGDKEQDYIAGFPWHPHRGIETITYLLEGTVEHSDSLGNKGTIGSGDVQWMTAGSGIIHQEMPQPAKNKHMGGFQLWANLSKADKMCNPKYRGVKANDIPQVKTKSGATIKIICGTVDKVKGPVHDIGIKPEYLDVAVISGGSFTREFNKELKVIVYVFEVKGVIEEEAVKNHDLLIFSGGGELKAKASEEGLRFLLLSGTPLKEPVAWYGPIVMNTEEELEEAFREYEEGTFIRQK